MSNVSAEDGGNYACQARLTHAGKQYSVLNSITVHIGKYAYAHGLGFFLALGEMAGFWGSSES